MFEATQLPAAISPPPRPQRAAKRAKRDRRLTLTKIDKRGRLGKRVVELTKLFSGGEISPVRKMKIEKAAQLTAIAELARGDFMRDGNGSLDDIVRLERKADQAVRALGELEQKPRPPTLAELMASPR